jgi:hypothetical protein
MTDPNVLIEALRADGIEPTPERLQRLDVDITVFAQILVDYFIYQKRLGKKITDPYSECDQSHERSDIHPRLNKRTGRGHKPHDTA